MPPIFEPPLGSLPALLPTEAQFSETGSSCVASNLALDQRQKCPCIGFELAAVYELLALAARYGASKRLKLLDMYCT